MDAKTVFTIISVTILANGTALAIAYRGLSSSLRPAARFWQWGTLLIAAGCALFAWGHFLPRPLMLTLANGAMAFGLTAYCLALRKVHGLSTQARLYVPAVCVTLGILWFSAVTPDFQVRVIIVSIAWLILASIALHALTHRPSAGLASSRNLLIGLLVLLVLCVAARLSVYLSPDIPSDFIIEEGASGWNLIYSIVLTMLPIVGTTGFLMLCADILRGQLEHAAATDYLTNLPNRRTVTQLGEQMYREAVQTQGSFAVAVVDIDVFKSLNDQFGHEAGDHALVHVGNRLRAETRADDMVARSGGEEFTILFSHMNAARAHAAVERMRLSIEQGNFVWREQLVPITVSAGVAARRHDDKSFEDILRRADQALYRAKSAGRNRIEVA